ncbi:MAG TPA: hypothetical protein PL041_04080 [Melioribacteraceae bacterium]|nr:hypothetical protein [Melioribacteraceae bacterium]
MQKIERHKVQKYGRRGTAISLPTLFNHDNGIKVGDTINIYRTVINDKDALVLIPEKNKEHNNSPIAN